MKFRLGRYIYIIGFKKVKRYRYIPPQYLILGGAIMANEILKQYREKSGIFEKKDDE